MLNEWVLMLRDVSVFPTAPLKSPSLELTGLLWIHHPFISCCHAEWKKDTRELSQTHTHTHFCSWEGCSLPAHWTSIEGYPLFEPLEGVCRRQITLSQMCLPPPPFTPSSAFHTIERDSLLPSKIHAVSTLKHTHIPTHICLLAWNWHTWTHLGLLLYSLLTRKFGHKLPLRDPELC